MADIDDPVLYSPASQGPPGTVGEEGPSGRKGEPVSDIITIGFPPLFSSSVQMC